KECGLHLPRHSQAPTPGQSDVASEQSKASPRGSSPITFATSTLNTKPARLVPPNPIGAAPRLTHLRQLEAESIHIIREAVAESDNPVLLYSIGKDSSVLLHLALKAFYPGKLPFPLLHVDTTWKFRDMIAFRDRRAAELGLKLIVHINQDGLGRGIGPISHPDLHTDVMKTLALRQALENYGFDVALGGARRDEERSRA